MVNEFENILRDLIITILGVDPNNYKISSDRIGKWAEKNQIELNRKIGFKEDRLIYYSDFYDLKNIISKNWDSFLPILLNKRRFETFFEEIEVCRNNIAHGRELLKSQKLILEGVLLDLKNLRAIYHNRNEMKEDYFIRINKVSDNLGNVWTDTINTCKKPLRVGDNYEIIIEAVDPKHREIEYEVSAMNKNFNIVQKENVFNFVIPESLISKTIMIIIKATTPKSEYQNQTQFQTVYSIIPQK